MSPDSVPDWWRGPGPEMIPTAGPPGGRPFTRQHQYLPMPPYMYAAYQPQHQVSNWHSINSLKPEVNLNGIKKISFCITENTASASQMQASCLGK